MDFLHFIKVQAIIERTVLTRSLTIRLEQCNLTKVPDSVPQLLTLQELYMSHNQLRDIPPELARLQSLQVLACDYNKLTTFPMVLIELKSLTCLNLNCNPIGVLPPIIGQLINLQVLWLNKTGITSLPKEIGELVNLDTFGARSNNISELPPEISNLRRLRWLTLENNMLEEFDDLRYLTSLIHLNLSKNLFKELPYGLSFLKELKYCNLSSCRLTTVNVEIINQMPQVKKLDMTDNNINVQTLDLSNLECLKNEIVEITPNIFNRNTWTNDEESCCSSSNDCNMENVEEEDDDDDTEEDWEESIGTSEINSSESEEGEELGEEDAVLWGIPMIAKYMITS